MSSIVKVKSKHTGLQYQYFDTGEPLRGGVKDVYFSPDKQYVVAIFRAPLDENQKERLHRITDLYLKRIQNSDASDYFLNQVFRWPTDIIERNGLTGIIVPVYHPNFFFKTGYASSDLIQGKEKNGKWFAGAKFRNAKFPLSLDRSELGDWLSYLQICVNLCRGVKKLHAMGLAHSDLSYNNVLVDPVTKTACIIDIDGLVVPGLFPAEVIGTAEFIAPEVMASRHLPKTDPLRKLPRRETDLHSLAVLIYMYLLHRHPLIGGKVHDLDPETDNTLAMGEKALFIEHPADNSNRPKPAQISKWEQPWADIERLPYTILGPYLKPLFDEAFITGLHDPAKRPTAEEWEQALLKTSDLLQPCVNPGCEQKWYVFNNTSAPRCPFCGTAYHGSLPVLDLYYQSKPGTWSPENHRLMVYSDQYLFQWHVNRNLIRNEKLSTEQKQPVGYFSFYQDKWVLVNQTMMGLKDLSNNTPVPVGSMVELVHGHQLLLSAEEGGRLVLITLVNA
jgi:hypothetical protein